jgi:hypothetical protein
MEDIPTPADAPTVGALTPLARLCEALGFPAPKPRAIAPIDAATLEVHFAESASEHRSALRRLRRLERRARSDAAQPRPRQRARSRAPRGITRKAESTGESSDGDPPPPAEYLDDRELARRTPIKRITWQVWRTKGEGPVFYKVGRRCLYRWSEVEAWISGQRVGKVG